MRRGRGREIRDRTLNFSNLSSNEIKALERAKNILNKIKQDNNLNDNDMNRLLTEEQTFPINIITRKTTILSSIVKYLKEEKRFSFSGISDVIGRDQRNVWNIYNKVKDMKSPSYKEECVKYRVPVSTLKNTDLSALEAIVVYTKDEFGLSFHEIAAILKRDDRTIWTVYRRAMRKNAKKE